MTVHPLNSWLEFGLTPISSISYIYFLYYIQSHYPPIKTQVPSEVSFPVSLSLSHQTSPKNILQRSPVRVSHPHLPLQRWPPCYRLFFLLCLFSREHYTNLSFGASLCLSIGCHIIIWKVKNSANTLPFSHPPCYWFNCQNVKPRLPATRTHGLRVSIFFFIFPLGPSTPENHPIPLLEVLVCTRTTIEYFIQGFSLPLSVEKITEKPIPK